MFLMKSTVLYIMPKDGLCDAIALKPMSSKLEGEMNSQTQRSLYMTIIS